MNASARLLRVGLLGAAVALAVLPPPALAQQMDHSKMNMAMPMPAARKPPAKKVPAKKAPSKPATASPAPMDHSKMDMSMPMDHSKMDMSTPMKPAPAPTKPSAKKKAARRATSEIRTTKKPATRTIPATREPAMDHSAMGHGMPMPADPAPSMQPMDHAAMGHDMGTMPMDHSAMPGMTMAPTEPVTPIPALTDADRAAAAPPAGGHSMHDNSIHSFVLFDRLEAWNADSGAGTHWEGKAWIGTDLDRLWLRSEGERVDGRTESADLEVLYGRSVAAWWDVVAGIRHDFKPGASQDFAAIGVMGLVPYKFELAATAYVGQSGQTAARIEAEYETLLTNRLILQPLVEVNLFGRNDAGRGIGAGLSTVEAGLRLRYEFTRRFAPYIGIVRERAFSRTADFRRAEGEDIDDTRFVAGVRLWF